MRTALRDYVVLEYSRFRMARPNVAHFFGAGGFHVRRAPDRFRADREIVVSGPSARGESADPEDFAPGKPYLRIYAKGDPGPFRLERNRGDGPALPVRLEGPRVHELASRRDPTREAARALATVRIRPRDVVVVLGAGSPVLLSQLSAQLREGQLALVLDASFALGCALVQASSETRAFLSRPGCHLFCGPELLDSLWSYLESLPADGFVGVRFVPHPPSLRRDPVFFSATQERIKKILQAKMSDLLTRFEFEKNWIRNIIANTMRLPPAGETPGPHTLARWEGCLQGRPAVLVAAGPSLRESLPLLAELRTRAFIVACDTAFKVLSKSGVLPHAIVTLDAQKHTLFHFLGEPDLAHVVLFADLVVHPLVLRSIAPRGVIFSTTARHGVHHDGSFTRETTPGSAYAEALVGSVGDVQSGGSVATSGFDLLRLLGAGQILLLGQDLAYSGREIHSTGTHHNERWLTTLSRTKSLEQINEAVMRKRRLVDAAAIGGGVEPSDYVLELYRHWFEDAIPRAGLPVWNLSARGACIAGAQRPENLAAFVQGLAPFPEADRLLAEAPTLSFHEHQVGRKLYARLAVCARPGTPRQERDRFFQSYPELEALRRQARAYLKRNRDRLTDARAETVFQRFEDRGLRELERGLRPYLGMHNVE